MCSVLPFDSDWRTQTKVYLEIPAGNMKRIGLNRFCKRHMSTSGSVVQFDRFWGYVRNILVCQKGGRHPLIVKILGKPVMTGIARPWPPSESGTIGYVSAENRSTGECYIEGLLVFRHLAMPIWVRCFLGGFPCVKYAVLWSIIHFWTIYFCRVSVI